MKLLTSYYLPPVIAFFENEILKETGVSKPVLYEKAIRHFKENGCKINENVLKIPKGERTIKEQIYLNPKDEEWIKRYVLSSDQVTSRQRYVVLMQALIEYCYNTGVKILTEYQSVGIATGIKYIDDENLRWNGWDNSDEY